MVVHSRTNLTTAMYSSSCLTPVISFVQSQQEYLGTGVLNCPCILNLSVCYVLQCFKLTQTCHILKL